jgi:hypothetical protein
VSAGLSKPLEFVFQVADFEQALDFAVIHRKTQATAVMRLHTTMTPSEAADRLRAFAAEVEKLGEPITPA